MLSGPIFQIAYVVDDIEAAADHWVQTLGSGPFLLLRHMKHDPIVYRGAHCDADYSAAFAMLGDIQIELIEQHNDKPSPYLAFKGKPGLHHVAVASKDLESDTAKLLAAGATQAGHARGQTGVRWALFEGTAHGTLELVEFPEGPGLSDYLRSASRDWDGKTTFLGL